MESWTIGTAGIARIVELVSNIPPRFLIPDATPENLAPMLSWLKPHFINDDGTMPLSFHAFLVMAGGQKILVDTCIGNDKPRDNPDWNRRQGNFLQQLAARGAPADEIDIVLCTHLHVDHVGWNTRWDNGRWIPTFPNARYLFAEAEWAFWEHEEDPFGKEAKFDSILPIIESNQVDLVATDHVINPEVRFVPTPGHTPGHVSVLIESGGEQAIITGDLFHHPLQFARPDWHDTADVDTKQAAHSRKRFMADFHADTLVLGTHFDSPTAGRLVAEAEHYRFET